MTFIEFQVTLLLVSCIVGFGTIYYYMLHFQQNLQNQQKQLKTFDAKLKELAQIMGFVPPPDQSTYGELPEPETDPQFDNTTVRTYNTSEQETGAWNQIEGLKSNAEDRMVAKR